MPRREQHRALAGSEAQRFVQAPRVLHRLGFLWVFAQLMFSLNVTSARAEEPHGGDREHVPDTQVGILLREGEWVTAGTCGLPQARFEGDTTLALLGPDGARVASNDDACGGLGSRLSYQATRTGLHQLVLGCYAAGCGGRVAWLIHDGELLPPSVELQGALEARAVFASEGQGVVANAWVAARLEALGGLTLRLEGAPMGLAGGRNGGVLGGSVQLLVGYDIGFVAVGVGGGVATLSRRAEGTLQREAGVLALRTRLGFFNEFHFGVQVLVAFPATQAPDVGLDIEAGLPVDAFEIVARGIYGMSGVWLAEIGLVWWPEGTSRRGVGVGVLAGASAVWYQPVCRFGLRCDETLYAGPHVGLGIHIRP